MFDPICITDIPREKVAKALVEVARTDMGTAIAAFKNTMAEISTKARNLNDVAEMKASVESIAADVAEARDKFAAAYDAALEIWERAREIAGETEAGDGGEEVHS